MQQRLLALAAELGLTAADVTTWFEPQPDHAALFLVETPATSRRSPAIFRRSATP